MIYDVLGVGFGPSNLALAIASQERTGDLSAVFLERQDGFGWHRGMLIEGTTMQVTFMKDLVTMRNPASDYSFLAYLHGQGRLVDFINHKSLFPSRAEFHGYLEWAAARLGHLVRYGHEVTAVRPVVEAGEVTHFEVEARGPAGPAAYAARSVVVATGLRPELPGGVEISPHVWHNQDFLQRMESWSPPPGGPRRLAVVGAGQSAAECTDYLHRRFPEAEVCSIFTKYGYTPADDSPFANRIFDPEAVDHFFGAPEEVKRRLYDYHRNTNYSVVDMDLIEELYRRSYAEKVSGRRRLRFLNATRVMDVHELPAGGGPGGERAGGAARARGGARATVEFLPTGERRDLDADLIVFATGYRPRDPAELPGLAGLCQYDTTGQIAVARDYRMITKLPGPGGIYLQGATEHTHGITSSLLSNTAIRVSEILDAIERDKSEAETPTPDPAAV